MTEEKFSQLERKIDILVNLMAYQMVKDMTTGKGGLILRRLGMEPAEMAAIFNSTPNAVSVAISKEKKKN